jgi:hypothetical protein
MIKIIAYRGINVNLKKVISILGCTGLLVACASGGIAVNAPDFQNKFASGNIRLTCKLECSGTVGFARQKMKNLYNNKLWMDLAKEVSSIGFENDQQYFYLGAAAAGLGYRNAARTYFSLANATTLKCGGSPNVCDGLNVPADINTWVNALNAADAKDAAAKSNLPLPRPNDRQRPASVLDLR